MRVFDAHLHVVDPRFPLVPNAGFVPEAFPVAAYRAETDRLGVAGGAVVSGSFQAFDTAHLVDALDRLGGAFVGVAQLPADVPDALRRLVEVNPEAVVFGTDLPSTRAPRPFSPADLRLVRDALDPEAAERVLWANAVALYRPRALPPRGGSKAMNA